MCGTWRNCLSQNCLNNYRIAAKFFFLMGINWTIESAVFLLGWTGQSNLYNSVFKILDFIKWSIGIILLVLFLCNLKNRKLVKILLASSYSSYENIPKTLNSKVSNSSSDSKLSKSLKKS